METTSPGDGRLRARRAALVVLVWSFFGILGGLSFAFAAMAPTYAKYGMKLLPAPTEGFWLLGDALHTLPGLTLAVLLPVLATSLILRGAWDRHLGRLTAVLIVGIPLLCAACAASLVLPFFRVSACP